MLDLWCNKRPKYSTKHMLWSCTLVSELGDEINTTLPVSNEVPSSRVVISLLMRRFPSHKLKSIKLIPNLEAKN